MNRSHHGRTDQQVTATSGAPNKPMVPTALASPAVTPSRPTRRHIGQSFGGEAP